jgi:hypothetical protein
MSKIGDIEQEIDPEGMESGDASNTSKFSKSKNNLLRKLKNYDYLVAKNIYIEEEVELPQLQLDFNF